MACPASSSGSDISVADANQVSPVNDVAIFTVVLTSGLESVEMPAAGVSRDNDACHDRSK